MSSNIKMDDSKIKIDLDVINVKDILQYCKPKEQLVLVKKFGLSNGVETPLQKIGEEYGLTRERIRQIEGQGLMRFRRLSIGNKTYVKVIEEATKILNKNGGFLIEDIFISKLLNKGLFKFNFQELKLILVSDFDIYYLKRNKYINKGFYVVPMFEDALTKISIYTQDYFKKNKVEDLYKFIENVKKRFTEKYENIHFFNENIFYLNFLKSIRGISILNGKIGSSESIEVNPKTIKEKILYILRKTEKILHYQEITTKVMESFQDKPVKVNTIHNELVKNNEIFVNMGLGIYGLREWGYEGGTVKDIIQRILKKNNRTMSIKEITKEVLKEKMVSPNTIVLTLQKYKDIFVRVGKGLYTQK